MARTTRKRDPTFLQLACFAALGGFGAIAASVVATVVTWRNGHPNTTFLFFSLWGIAALAGAGANIMVYFQSGDPPPKPPRGGQRVTPLRRLDTRPSGVLRTGTQSRVNDDMAFLEGRIADYRGYDDETHRHDSDMRVRAYVGEALTSAQTRLGAGFTSATKSALEAVLYRCMFTDQVFVRKFEHAELDAAMTAALVHSDRVLIGYGDEAKSVTSEKLPALVRAIDEQFEYRRAPSPYPGD